jgi:hypothetical protein
MIREIEIQGQRLRLHTSRRHGYKSLTYFYAFHDGRWLNCGDPLHGETSSAGSRAVFLHSARIAIRKYEKAKLLTLICFCQLVCAARPIGSDLGDQPHLDLPRES